MIRHGVIWDLIDIVPLNSPIKNISSVMTNNDSFEPAVWQLCSTAKLNADQCLAHSELLFANAIYKSIAVKSIACNVLTTTMEELQHNKLYKHYYALMIFC